MCQTLDLAQDSKYQEQIIEYKFVSDLMVSLAYMNKKLEVLRVHSDSFGYDLILKVDDVIKFVQLKSSIKSGKNQYWDIHKSLLLDDNGIVLVVFYSFEKSDLILEYCYLDFTKYSSTLENLPKHKKDSSKYCCACAKNLVKVSSINEISELFIPYVKSDNTTN